MSFKISRIRRGSAMIITMMMLLLLSMIGSAMVGMSVQDLRGTHRRADAMKALNLAISGLDIAVGQIQLIDTYGGFHEMPMGDGSVTVEITAAMPAGSRYITSTATVPIHGGGTVTRSVRGTAGVAAFPPLFGKALVAKKKMEIADEVTVDSLVLPLKGDVHSNGDLHLLNSQAKITGDLTASGELQNDGADIDGKEEDGVDPVIFPAFDQLFKDLSLVGGTVPPVSILNLGYSSNGAATPTITVNGLLAVLKGKINGNLVVGPQGCLITGVVWVTGTVDIRGPITGAGTIVADGNVKINVQNNYLVPTPELVAVGTTSADPLAAVEISGDKMFKGMVYAPNGHVKVSGSPHILGGIMSNTMAISGGGKPHVTAFASPGGLGVRLPSFLDLQVWEEGPFPAGT